MSRNNNSYYQNQLRRSQLSQLPRLQPLQQPVRTMAGPSKEEHLSMQDMNYSQPRYSRSPSLNEENAHRSSNINDMRPNRVISGHRRIHTLYTGPRVNLDNHANKIVAKMEQDKALMEDTPISEQLRKEALRELPQCLTMKRCVKMKLTKSVSQKSKRKPIGFLKSLKYRMNIKFGQLKYNVKNFNYFKLWHGTLKNIEGRFGSAYATYFKFLRWLFVMNFFVSSISFSLLAVPQIIYDASGENEATKNTSGFKFEDLFIGQGFFSETILYYGHYTNISINLVPHLFYNMPAAYFSAAVILYLLSFVVLSVSVAQSYRRTFIETEGGLQNIYANKIFCGWDYSIATQEAAELKSSAIYNELKELLSESREDNLNRSCLAICYTYTIQVIVNILILIILGGVGWVCWLLLDQFSLSGDSSVIVTTVVVNIFMMVFPVIFSYISKYEDYNNPRTALYITLVRTYLLGSVIIGVIITFWLFKASNKSTVCWENHFASEIYRLILFDFFFSVVLITVIEILYAIVQRLRGKDPKSEFNISEFNISRHTLQIIYNQALFWVAFFYSPILPVLITLKMLFIWYIREACIRKFCKPPKRIWRAAQAQTWFMMLIFISNLLIIAVHGYTMRSIPPSNCGPFRDYDYIYQIVINNVSELEHDSNVWYVVMQITKPGAVALIMIALAILVYYLKEQAYAQKEKVKMLREMLAWTGKDKKYLVCLYNQVTKGQSEINFSDNRLIDPSKVLTYELPDDYFNRDLVGANSVNEDDYNRFKKFY